MEDSVKTSRPFIQNRSRGPFADPVAEVEPASLSIDCPLI
jgi:hypothetical protein